MAKYGKYHINFDVGHVIVGDVGEAKDLVVGDFEPATPEEAAACAHLASVSFQPAGAEMSQPYAELVEPPSDDVAPDESAAEPPAGAGDGGSEPPAGPAGAGEGAASEDSPTSPPAPADNQPPAGDQPPAG